MAGRAEETLMRGKRREEKLREEKEIFLRGKMWGKRVLRGQMRREGLGKEE